MRAPASKSVMVVYSEESKPDGMPSEQNTRVCRRVGGAGERAKGGKRAKPQ